MATVVNVNPVARPILICLRQFPDIIVPYITETTTNPGSTSRIESVSGSIAQQTQTAADDIQSVIKARKYVTIVGMVTRARRHVIVVNATHIVTHEQKSARHNIDDGHELLLLVNEKMSLLFVCVSFS